jgi:beta-galactosidase
MGNIKAISSLSIRFCSIFLIVSFTCPLLLAQANLPKSNPMTPNGNMYIGVDYYPEHWPEERWEYDIKLMKQADFNIVRLAEFSWVLLEPQESMFDFTWLDKVIQLFDKYKIKVILGTPTAVMPAWLAQKYPETLAMKPDGTRIIWGGRKNNCFSSGTYRLLSDRITRAMTKHYVSNPAVIGWQTDNEFGDTDCRCHSCLAEFQDWLKNKYKSLDHLNQAWGTHFWGLTVQTWGEITIPDSRSGKWAISNPSASLDWDRFASWLNVRFQADQVSIIREICPAHFVTHNFMGLYSGLNYYDLAKDLDFVSWDNYPVFSNWNQPGINYDASFAADVMRGLKQQNFWIMEQTAGPLGWETFSRNPRPGEIRNICFQQLAHGADGQIWFRWRTCTAGREQYWHGLLGHDGKPLRRYEEAKQTASDYRKIEKYLQGTTVKSKVAIIYDYESMWALSYQPGYIENSFQDTVRRYYKAFFRAGINVDMISPSADISKYKLVLAPDLFILPDHLAKKVDSFVKKGGIFVTDCRFGVKDENNLCHERTLPGLLSGALGIQIEEYESLSNVEYPLKINNLFSGPFTASLYTDWIKSDGAEILANYDEWHMHSFAAVTRNQYGKGIGWYVGTIVKEPSFYDQLITFLLNDAGIKPIIKPPIGIEVSIREGDGKKLLFIINHTEKKQTVSIPKGKNELIGQSKTNDTIEIDRLGVAIILL